MMFIIKNVKKSLFFCLFALNFCWASVDTEPVAAGTKTVVGNKSNTAVKFSPLAAKDEVKLPSVDFSKILLDISKKMGGKPLPLLTIESESLPKLLQKVTQVADKVVPDCSSLISFAVTGFAGGLSCPGVDEKAACYAVIFLNEGNIEPVFLFKAQPNCALIKSLKENETAANVLKAITSSTDKNYCWQMYGNADLLKTLDKSLAQVFPFIYQERVPEMCLKVVLDINLWNDIFQKIDDKGLAFPKFIWDTLIGPDVKRTEMGFDIVDKMLVTKTFVYPQEYSLLASFTKSLAAKTKEVKFLNWSSREAIQELVFQNYSGLRNYVESLDDRIKYSQNTVDFCTSFKNIWGMVCPLIKDFLAFCDKNLTGNTQSYADLQSSEDLISSKGFGFFEGKQLKRETILKFIEDFSGKISSSLKEYADKKYFYWEICKDIALNVKRSVEKHHDCDIDQIFWRMNGNEAHCPIWFAVYKNYLLYADDIGNVKRLIERMEEMKTPSYASQEGNCFSHMTMNFASIMRTLGVAEFKAISELSVEITCGLKEGAFVNTVKVPGFLDVFSLKTILPSAGESAKKENVILPNRPMTVPMGK